MHADSVDEDRDNGRPGGASQAGACADETEQPLGLTRVVHVVCNGPELTDEQHSQNLTEHVEGDGHPLGARPQQEEKRISTAMMAACVAGITCRRGRRAAALVPVHQDGDDDPLASSTYGSVSDPDRK